MIQDEPRPLASRLPTSGAPVSGPGTYDEVTVVRALSDGRAAHLLWLNGYPHRALLLYLESVECLVREFSKGSPVSHGLAERPYNAFRAAVREIESAPLLVDASASWTAEHQKLLEACGSAHAVARRLVRPAASRALIGTGLAVACVVGALAWWWQRQIVTVTCSASYSQQHRPARVLDDQHTTDWLLPDGQLGWLEARFRRPRSLQRIELQTARNYPYLDRSTHRFRIEAFNGSEAVATWSGAFDPAPQGPPGTAEDTLTISTEGQVADRIRLYVESFHGLGGGFAEVDVF
jgi:hypothetical protein